MADNNTLYSYSSDNDNLDSRLITGMESNAAGPSDAIENTLLRSKINGEEFVGTMPVNNSVDVTITPYASEERIYNILKGYHPGTGIIRVPSLKTLTTPTTGAVEYHLENGRYVSTDIKVNRTAWINGLQVWGIYNGDTGLTGTAQASDIRINKTAWVGGNLITGNLQVVDPVSDINLSCGGSFTIPAGIHGGNRKVNAYSLASQTQVLDFTYTEVIIGDHKEYRSSQLMEGKDVWANGLHVFGTLDMDSYIETYLGSTDTMPNHVAHGKVFYSKSSGGIAIGTMQIRENPETPVYMNAGQSYTILDGYHSGNQVIHTNPLDTQTIGSATDNDIRENKTAWVNGVQILGNLLTRTPIEDTGTKTLLAGEQYRIERGIYNGSDVIFATPLDAQTIGTVTAEQVLYSYTCWVNGIRVVGTMPNIGHSQSGNLVVGSSITISRGYHDGTEVITAVSQ